jgi:hypothetical protein
VEKPKAKRSLEDLDIDGRITLKSILGISWESVGTIVCITIGTSGGLL